MNPETERIRADILHTLANEKNVDLTIAVESALTDDHLLQQMLEGIVSRSDVYRYNCFKVLLSIAQEQPQRMASSWQHLVELTKSENSFHRAIAVQIIANLATLDDGKEFERIYDGYFSLLNDESLVVARYVARSAGTIARAVPRLQPRITRSLLSIDLTDRDQERKDLVKADAIHSFAQFVETSGDKKEILDFVERQLNCTSPKTRRDAKTFLGKHGP